MIPGWLTCWAGDGDGNTLQLVHLQPRASECVEIYGLDAWDLHRVDGHSSCTTSLSVPKLGERLHRGQCDLCSGWTLDLNGLPAHLAVWAHGAQEDGACVWHNLKILQPFLAERRSSKYLTACCGESPGLDGLELSSTLEKMLRLEKDLLWLLPISVVWLYRDTQRCCVMLVRPRHDSIAVVCLSHSIRRGLCGDSRRTCHVTYTTVGRHGLLWLLLDKLASPCIPSTISIPPCTTCTDRQQSDVSIQWQRHICQKLGLVL